MQKINEDNLFIFGRKFKIVEFFVGAPTQQGRFTFYEVYEKKFFFWKKLTFVYKSEFEDLPIIETTKFNSMAQVIQFIKDGQSISKGDVQYVG